MSERRSTEIKFRTTPSFKARVQAAAAAADKSMSEYIEECAETRMWADANQKIDGTALLGNAILTLRDIPSRASSPPQNLNPILEAAFLTQPDADVDTTGEPEPKGWMFEARR